VPMPSPPAEPTHAYDNMPEGLRKRKSMSSMPASFSPESTGMVEEKNQQGKLGRILGRGKGKGTGVV